MLIRHDAEKQFFLDHYGECLRGPLPASRPRGAYGEDDSDDLECEPAATA